MACESCARRRAKLLKLAQLAAERAKALFEKREEKPKVIRGHYGPELQGDLSSATPNQNLLTDGHIQWMIEALEKVKSDG